MLPADQSRQNMTAKSTLVSGVLRGSIGDDSASATTHYFSGNKGSMGTTVAATSKGENTFKDKKPEELPQPAASENIQEQPENPVQEPQAEYEADFAKESDPAKEAEQELPKSPEAHQDPPKSSEPLHESQPDPPKSPEPLYESQPDPPKSPEPEPPKSPEPPADIEPTTNPELITNPEPPKSPEPIMNPEPPKSPEPDAVPDKDEEVDEMVAKYLAEDDQ